MFEIFLFAALSFYLLSKLWAVLGQSDERHKKRKTHIIYGNSATVVKSEENFLLDGPKTLTQKLEYLIQQSPHFQASTFLTSAEKVYKILLGKSSPEVLEKLLTPSFAQKWSPALETAEVNSLESDIIDITFQEKLVNIVVQFSAIHVLGEIFHKVREYWIFEKNLDTQDPTWKVSDVKSSFTKQGP